MQPPRSLHAWAKRILLRQRHPRPADRPYTARVEERCPRTGGMSAPRFVAIGDAALRWGTT
jgi:hypothetical protein